MLPEMTMVTAMTKEEKPRRSHGGLSNSIDRFKYYLLGSRLGVNSGRTSIWIFAASVPMMRRKVSSRLRHPSPLRLSCSDFDAPATQYHGRQDFILRDLRKHRANESIRRLPILIT